MGRGVGEVGDGGMVCVSLIFSGRRLGRRCVASFPGAQIFPYRAPGNEARRCVELMMHNVLVLQCLSRPLDVAQVP